MSEVTVEVEVIFKKKADTKVFFKALNVFQQERYEEPSYEHQVERLSNIGIDITALIKSEMAQCRFYGLSYFDDYSVRFTFSGGVYTGSSVWSSFSDLMLKASTVKKLTFAELNDQVMEWSIVCFTGNTLTAYETGMNEEVDRLIFESMNDGNTIDVVKKLNSKRRLVVKGIYNKARMVVSSLMDLSPEEETQEIFDEAVKWTIMAIKNGHSDIVDYYEAMQTVPGREMEWAAIQSFPNIPEKDSEHIKHLVKTISRAITEEEYKFIRNLSEELLEGYNNSVK